MVCLKGFLCDSASKSIGFCNIFTHFTMFSTIFVRANCSADRTQFNPYYTITVLRVLLEEIIDLDVKVFLSSSFV